MKEITTKKSGARYLDIIFPWNEDLCTYKLSESENRETVPMVQNGYWHGVIDIKNHTLIDALSEPYELQAIVRDAGIYTLLDEKKNPICSYRGYAPTLPFNKTPWSDHIYLHVNRDNTIINWDSKIDLSSLENNAAPISQYEYDLIMKNRLAKSTTLSSKSGTEILEHAAQFMMDVHEGQTDKAGQPYILHPMRVALDCEGNIQKTVAFLHDVLEDSDLSSHDLMRYGFPNEVCEAVLALTRKPGEDYETFIARCSMNPISRYVKIRDIEDNLNVQRLHDLDEPSVLRINKYLKALRFLKSQS